HPMPCRISIGLRYADLLRTGHSLAAGRQKRSAPAVVRAEGPGAISDGFSFADGDTAQYVGIAVAKVGTRVGVIARVIATACVVGAARHAGVNPTAIVRTSGIVGTSAVVGARTNGRSRR